MHSKKLSTLCQSNDKGIPIHIYVYKRIKVLYHFRSVLWTIYLILSVRATSSCIGVGVRKQGDRDRHATFLMHVIVSTVSVQTLTAFFSLSLSQADRDEFSISSPGVCKLCICVCVCGCVTTLLVGNVIGLVDRVLLEHRQTSFSLSEKLSCLSLYISDN